MGKCHQFHAFKILFILCTCSLCKSQKGNPHAMSAGKEVDEYCLTQVFNASCPYGHVILMTHARYGRMRIGNCVKRDYGHIGCSSDVTALTDSRCSGKSSCSIRVPDVLFEKTQPCPEDLKLYLEVAHSCVKVSKSNHNCNVNKAKEVNADPGYILNSPRNMEPCGGAQSPWVIQSQPGQTITVTLYDFSIESRMQRGSSHSYIQCHPLAVLRETSGDQSKNLTVCGRSTRELVVLTTQANKVEIVTPRTQDTYMLKYQISGCPEFKPPAMSWVVRTGNSALVKCNYTRQIFHLKCNGNSWEGEIDSCSLDKPAERNDDDDEVIIPYGVSILIVVIIALVIGLIVLVLGLLFLRKQHSVCMRRHGASNATYAPDKDYVSSSYYQSYTPKPGRPVPCGDGPVCAPLMGNTSVYGQIPERFACGCPVYISRDEMAEMQHVTPRCCADQSCRTSTELLEQRSGNSTPKVVSGPDMLPLSERQQLVQTEQTDSILKNSKNSTHSTFKQSSPNRKREELNLKLRFDDVISESTYDENRSLEPKTQVVKPLPIALPPPNATIGTLRLPLAKTANGC